MSILTSYPRVYIVILNWTRPHYTLASMRSLAGSDYPCHQVVVVDNGSADDSPTLIRQQFPQAIVIENYRNLGFAGGSNVGISYAVQNGADYVLLLNDDTEISPEMLRVLVEVGESSPGVGILGPKIYYYDPKEVIWSAGGAVGPSGEPSHLRMGQTDVDGSEIVTEVDYVSGCAMMVKRQVIDKVGLLDDRFFAYFEETEWCARARRAGLTTVYVPRARMWHKISPSARERSRTYLYLMARNRLLYLQCSGADPRQILTASIELIRTAASWSFRAGHREMRGYSSTVVRGVLDFARGRFGAPPALS